MEPDRGQTETTLKTMQICVIETFKIPLVSNWDNTTSQHYDNTDCGQH